VTNHEKISTKREESESNLGEPFRKLNIY